MKIFTYLPYKTNFFSEQIICNLQWIFAEINISWDFSHQDISSLLTTTWLHVITSEHKIFFITNSYRFQLYFNNSKNWPQIMMKYGLTFINVALSNKTCYLNSPFTIWQNELFKWHMNIPFVMCGHFLISNSSESIFMTLFGFIPSSATHSKGVLMTSYHYIERLLILNTQRAARLIMVSSNIFNGVTWSKKSYKIIDR